MPNPPILLVDNVFDITGLYPGATPLASSEADGHEAFRVGDGRRDRTFWQALYDGHGSGDQWVGVGLLVAVSVDAIYLDRGHNLAGKTLHIESSADGVTWSVAQSLTVPSTLGGSVVAPSMCQTEEGAAWSLMAMLDPSLYWRLSVPQLDGFVPLITGVLLGKRTQLVNYSKTFDEDAGGRTQSNDQSTAGYRSNDTTYSWRTVTLDLDLIGAAEYDTTMRSLRTTLFEKNQPWVGVMDSVTHPERAWMYRLDSTTWGMAKTRVYRSGRLVGREHMPRLR